MNQYKRSADQLLVAATLSEQSSDLPDCVVFGCAASAVLAAPSTVAVAHPVGKLVIL